MGLVLACFALSALSLLAPYSLEEDEWSWLIWGREVRQLQLHLEGGSLWKPLPVLVTVFVSTLGESAPNAWLALTRMSWLLALIAAYRAGTHLGGRAAGGLSVGALLLIPQGAEWLVYAGRGSSEPLIVALVLWAIDRHIHGQRLLALGLAALAALGRPEPWPLVVAYAAFVWPGLSARGRAAAVTLVAAVPVLWLGGFWWGSETGISDALRYLAGPAAGVSPALAVAASARSDVVTYLGLAAPMVIVPVWLAAGFAALRATAALRSGDDREAALTLALAVGALAWTLIVLVDGLPVSTRFLFGPAALVSIVAAAGMVWAVGAVRPGSRALLGAAIALATLPFVAERAAGLREGLPRGRWAPFADPPWVAALERARAAERLNECDDKVLVRPMRGSGNNRTRGGKFARSEIAWRLGARLSWVDRLSGRRTTRVERALLLAPAGTPPPLGRMATTVAEAAAPGGWRRVAAANGWIVYEVGCRQRILPGPRAGNGARSRARAVSRPPSPAG